MPRIFLSPTMRKKTSKATRKDHNKSVKKPADKSSEKNSELQEEIRIGREFMAQYEATFKKLAKG